MVWSLRGSVAARRSRALPVSCDRVREATADRSDAATRRSVMNASNGERCERPVLEAAIERCLRMIGMLVGEQPVHSGIHVGRPGGESTSAT